MHDWEKDLHAGLSTYVVTAILRDMGLPPGKYSFAKLLPKMQRQFWHHTLNHLCEVMVNHSKQARRCARSSGLLKDKNVISTVLDKIDASLEMTLNEQKKAEDFLTAYGQTKPAAK